MWTPKKGLIIQHKTSKSCYRIEKEIFPISLLKVTPDGRVISHNPIEISLSKFESSKDSFELLQNSNSRQMPVTKTSISITNEPEKLVLFFSGKDPKDTKNILNGHCPVCARSGRLRQWSFGRAASKVCNECNWRDS